MSVKIEKFVRKQFPVDCVQVTAENIEEVAKWCNGTIHETDPEIAEKFKKPVQRWIQVDVQNAMNERQTKAFVDDWVLFANRGYKIYTPNAFERNFERPASAPAPTQQEKVFKGTATPATVQKVVRSAVSGEFVSKAEADANPGTTVTETVER